MLQNHGREPVGLGGSVLLSTEEDGRLEPTVVAALYLEHAEELKRFLVGLLSDTQLAHDVLQTTFAKLVEQGHQTRPTSRKSWLFQVAYREAMAILRRQAVGSRAVRRLAWTKPTAHASADEPLVRFEVVESVRAAMETLPRDQQQVVQMRIYEDRTFAEIAKQLNIPLGTALGRMRSAMAKLRTALEEHRNH